MSLHLITGYAGQEHITAADHASFNVSVFGKDNFVFERGNKFKAEIISNNLIRILDGDMMIQGRHVRLAENTYEELILENGTQGMKRNDLLVARYSKNATTGIEKCEFVILKGSSNASAATDPTYTTGDITENGNDLVTEFPLYRIKYDGLNIQEVKKMFSINKTLNNATVPTYKRIALKSTGWHRIAKIECDSLDEANGNLGNSCDIEINRSYNAATTEFKKIKLVSLFNSTTFTNETSKAISGSQLLTKIRHTTDTTNNVSYIEVYYNSDKLNNMVVTLSNHRNSYRRVWEIIEPEATAETVNGVNVLGSHDFLLNSQLVNGIDIIEQVYNGQTEGSSKEYFSYTAPKKCLLSVTFFAGHYEGTPQRVEVLKNGEFVSAMYNTSSHVSIPVTLILNKGVTINFKATYNKVCYNQLRLNGFVQYLE